MAIQQHPLPQDISSYRFRLIGDMTIKQFASLGISIVVAILFYSSPLPFFFKYPLSFLFLLLGVGMAFVPIQGRTLDAWIIAFIRSIYSPTQYVWKQTSPESSSANIPSSPNPVSPPAPAPLPETPISPSTPTTPLALSVSPETSVAPVSPPAPAPLPETPALSHLPIPFTPTTPNTLVGLTITSDQKILDGVMVEIQKDGLTVRATKSNKLGQFMFARPLDNGLYQIFAEKNGFTFAPYSLDLTGDIIRPLKIQAQ